MKNPTVSLFIAAALLTATAVSAEVVVKDAWVRATVSQQQATGAFMRLSAIKEMKLVSVSSPLTPTVEIHEMVMRDNVMRMRQVAVIELPAGRMVEFKSGGYHVMLMNLKQQVNVGDTVPLRLIFEDRDGQRETQQVQAQVRAFNSPMQPAAHGDQNH